MKLNLHRKHSLWDGWWELQMELKLPSPKLLPDFCSFLGCPFFLLLPPPPLIPWFLFAPHTSWSLGPLS